VYNGYRWDVSINGSEPIAARPVGSNYDYDLAVAYIYKEQLLDAGITSIAFATFGNSDEIRIGEVVLAIGNAMGDGTSVTRGIISAEERPVQLPDRFHPIMLLQTDAAINYGNSGGPLINTKGEIIGININQAAGLIIGSSLAEGMNFSISSNVAAPILEEIVATYRMPAMGIVGISLADDAQNRAAEWGIPELGALVVEVQEGRSADRAGILPGDLITSFDGQPIFDMLQLVTAVRTKEIGDIVEVRILRGGSFAITLQVELGMMYRDSF
jgi:serine protease Do